MNITRNKIIVTILVILIIVLGFSFHTPSTSLEGRINTVSEIFTRPDIVDVKRELKSYLDDLSSFQRLELFENLSFSLIKKHRSWLPGFLDEEISGWREKECFNTTYLMTEVALEEKRNMKVIKNMEPVQLKMKYQNLDDILDDVYALTEKSWSVKDGDFYVIDDTLKVKLRKSGGKSTLENFEIAVFVIDSGYKFEIEYRDETLVIMPLDEKVIDNGAYELREKIAYYEDDRIATYLMNKYGFSYTDYTLEYFDTYLNPTSDSSNKDSISSKYLDILYNRDYISILEDLGQNKYVASIRYTFDNVVIIAESSSEEKQKENVEKKMIYSINLFKSTY